MNKLYFFTTIALLALDACGSSGRPVGLPAPEYEQPQVEPWTPPSAAVAPSPPEPQATPEPAPVAAPENVAGSGATLPAGTP
jgi:hypothetical protein